MKIAIICYNHFDATISLAKHLYQINQNVKINLIFILSQTYLDVEIISLKNKKVKNGFIDTKKILTIIDEEIFNYLNNKILLQVFIFNSYKLIDFKNFQLLAELKNNINKEKFDMLHFVGNNHWIIMLNYLLKNTPRIHTLHEPYPFTKISPYRLLRHKLKITLLIKFNTYITVPSITSYERFKNNFLIDHNRLSIIPFGPFEIYKEYSKIEIDRKDNVILYYGNISKYKGIEVLIEAMKKVIIFNPSLKLIIAGGGRFSHDISLLEKNIELINRHLTNKEIAELNQLATVVICPYTSASQSGVVMTSFAFGNPIIASNVGALPEMIKNKETGIIVEPANSEILYSEIVNLFENSTTIKQMRANVISNYFNSNRSWEYIASETFKLYKTQIEDKKRIYS